MCRGRRWTVGDGVNHKGIIAGWFKDTSNATHGYIWSAGTFTQLDVPGADATWALANNDAGAWSADTMSL